MVHRRKECFGIQSSAALRSLADNAPNAALNACRSVSAFGGHCFSRPALPPRLRILCPYYRSPFVPFKCAKPYCALRRPYGYHNSGLDARKTKNRFSVKLQCIGTNAKRYAVLGARQPEMRELQDGNSLLFPFEHQHVVINRIASDEAQYLRLCNLALVERLNALAKRNRVV